MIFTTSDGKEIQYQSISPMEIQEIRLAIIKKHANLGKRTEPPKYKVKIGDAEQTFSHDEKSIVDPNTPQEEKVAWEEYITHTHELEEEINEKISGLIYGEGAIVDEIPETWKQKRAWKGLEVPENFFDAKVKYITTELLRTPQDLQEFVIAVMKLSMQGVGSEAIEAAEETFRNTTKNRKSGDST